MILHRESVRVLGALMEKEMTTPESYPLSLNSLIAAANQKTSRDPLMELSEQAVRQALDQLQSYEMVSVTRDSRVPKFEHRIRTVLALRRDETAVLCLLMLRGPQTAAELRSRSDRMFSFADTSSVQAALDRLAGRPDPLVILLPRLPGARECRTMHLLTEMAAASTSLAASQTPRAAPESPEAAPSEVAELRERVDKLEWRMEALERQFTDR